MRYAHDTLLSMDVTQGISTRMLVGMTLVVALAAGLGAIAGLFVLSQISSGYPMSPFEAGGVPTPLTGCNVLGIQVHGMIVESRADIPMSDTQLLSLGDGSTYLAAPNYAVANEITDTLRSAASDASIRGLIVDIESGGGGVVAGQEIAAAIRRFGKPTLSVIHEVGASSGYLVAAAASTAYASSDSNVGSIGVTSSYISQVEKNKKDGYAYEQLSIGRFKDMMSPDKPLTAEEKALVMRDLAATREHFVDLITQYRSLDRANVDALADGSTMLGTAALENKLIDRIGSLDDAIQDLENEIGEPVSICWQ